MELPPGFRFHPTDEEIIIHYLVKKVLDRRFRSRAIAEADMNKCEPWDLTENQKNGEREWFFCKKDRKYPTGTRTNRATESGYWKATGKDKEIFKGKNCLIGMKKTLVFYKGRAPKGEKTGWIMYEYRLVGSYCTDHYNIPKSTEEEWAVSRIFQRITGIVNRSTHPSGQLSRMEQHFLDSPTLPPLMDVSYRPTSSFTTLEDDKLIKENSSLPVLQDPNPNSHTFPSREFDRTGLRIVTENQGMLFDSPRTTYKMEQYFPMTNPMISVFQDASVAPLKGEIKREEPFDDEFEGLSFSPSVSDFDYLWSY